MTNNKWYIINTTETRLAGNIAGYASEVVAKGAMNDLRKLFPEWSYQICWLTQAEVKNLQERN